MPKETRVGTWWGYYSDFFVKCDMLIFQNIFFYPDSWPEKSVLVKQTYFWHLHSFIKFVSGHLFMDFLVAHQNRGDGFPSNQKT